MSTTASLTVVDRVTGEALDVRESSDVELALFCDNLSELRAELAEAEAIVNGELLARLDRSATWTRQVKARDGLWFEFSAPSPTAGTEAYDPSLLEGELRTLCDRNTIDETGAAAALERKVVIQVRVPLAGDMDAIVNTLKGATSFEIAGVDVEPVKAEASRSVKLGGITKLRKIEGTGAALDRAKLTKSPPSRRVSVKRKQKG